MAIETLSFFLHQHIGKYHFLWRSHWRFCRWAVTIFWGLCETPMNYDLNQLVVWILTRCACSSCWQIKLCIIWNCSLLFSNTSILGSCYSTHINNKRRQSHQFCSDICSAVNNWVGLIISFNVCFFSCCKLSVYKLLYVCWASCFGKLKCHNTIFIFMGSIIMFVLWILKSNCGNLMERKPF